MEPSVLRTRSNGTAAPETEVNCRVRFDQQNATLNLLGMTLIEVKPDGETCRKLASQRGVAVLVAARDLEAFRGGVRSGDIIAEVNSTKIRALQDLKKVLRLHDPLVPMIVFLLNSGGWRFANLSFVRGLPELVNSTTKPKKGD